MIIQLSAGYFRPHKVMLLAAGLMILYPSVPVAEDKARLDGDFLRARLNEPFNQSADRVLIISKILQQTGNREEGFRLRQALQRAVLTELLTGEHERSGTIKGAIARETIVDTGIGPDSIRGMTHRLLETQLMLAESPGHTSFAATLDLSPPIPCSQTQVPARWRPDPEGQHQCITLAMRNAGRYPVIVEKADLYFFSNNDRVRYSYRLDCQRADDPWKILDTGAEAPILCELSTYLTKNLKTVVEAVDRQEYRLKLLADVLHFPNQGLVLARHDPRFQNEQEAEHAARREIAVSSCFTRASCAGDAIRAVTGAVKRYGIQTLIGLAVLAVIFMLLRNLPRLTGTLDPMTIGQGGRASTFKAVLGGAAIGALAGLIHWWMVLPGVLAGAATAWSLRSIRFTPVFLIMAFLGQLAMFLMTLSVFGQKSPGYAGLAVMLLWGVISPLLGVAALVAAIVHIDRMRREERLRTVFNTLIAVKAFIGWLMYVFPLVVFFRH